MNLSSVPTIQMSPSHEFKAGDKVLFVGITTTEPRKGFIARTSRFLGLSYGWEQVKSNRFYQVVFQCHGGMTLKESTGV